MAILQNHAYIHSLKSSLGLRFFGAMFFLVVLYACYETSMKKIDEEMTRLTSLHQTIEQEIELTLGRTAEVQSELKNLEDKNEQELLLKRELGMIEDGETKVIFK